MGLACTNARLPSRLALALLWPLGPMAFAATVALLIVAAMIAFPVFAALALAGAAMGWIAWG